MCNNFLALQHYWTSYQHVFHRSMSFLSSIDCLCLSPSFFECHTLHYWLTHYSLEMAVIVQMFSMNFLDELFVLMIQIHLTARPLGIVGVGTIASSSPNPAHCNISWYLGLIELTTDVFGARCTVYPKKYAHGFCFALLCCGYTLTDFPISIRLTSLALWQSNDCPSASKATLMNMDKYFMWIHYERLHNRNKAKHNKTVCIFLGIYCIMAGFDMANRTDCTFVRR